jgi:hypothetical protein
MLGFCYGWASGVPASQKENMIAKPSGQGRQEVIGSSGEDYSRPLAPDYWANHPAEWPVTTLTLGAQNYERDELLALVRAKAAGDASMLLARELIATLLNLAAGADPDPILAIIGDAQAVLSLFRGKLPYAVRAASPRGRRILEDGQLLKAYNAGPQERS